MRKISFTPEGVCAKQIDMTITSDNLIKDLVFTGGCPGNALGISKLVDGMSIDKVIETLEGTTCGRKSTSCPDQLTIALKELINQKKYA